MRQSVETLQPHLLEQFEQILSQGRLSHAYLFSGTFGSLSLAKYLAQSRFCEQVSDQGLPCGNCRSCRLIAADEFADVKIIEPKGQVIKTEQIRDLTREFSQSGYESASQVFIVKEAERLHANAANSLLKQIEEPSSQYHIFLLTADESKVLPTIKSRCQIYRLRADRVQLQRHFEEAGLLKSQAQLLAGLVKDEADLARLTANKKLHDLLQQAQTFLESLERSRELAYFQIPALLALAGEKAEQDTLFEVLTLQAQKALPSPQALKILERLTDCRRMWLANVSLQNCLDYLVLTWD